MFYKVNHYVLRRDGAKKTALVHISQEPASTPLNSESISLEMVGLGVKPFVDVVDPAPLAVFGPFASPILALTERLEVRIVRLLQRPCNR